MDHMNDYILYILMRTDLGSLTPGRKMAQSSHASNAFIHEYGNRKDVQEWQKQTKQGFGTAIVLSIDMIDLPSLIQEVKHAKFPCGWVVDPTYSIKITREIYDMIPAYFRSIPPVFNEDGSIIFYKEETTCSY